MIKFSQLFYYNIARNFPHYTLEDFKAIKVMEEAKRPTV